ncbi:oligopeptidase A [Motiliproteus sediminis]|uniref:oligopeptidase A n=1 Tax=Motiliproteus sediminis TaxID=1468178 RepID=UPI001AEF55CE|nr:oligopeptidase A [Motiliproteus sediminis]
MTNPLLQPHDFPPFDQIRPQHVVAAIDAILAENRDALNRLLQSPPVDWTLVSQLEGLEERLSNAWSPVGHMNAVVNSDELREAYNAALPKLTAYYTELGQNRRLFEAYQALADSDAYQQLDPTRRKVVDNALRDFRLSGVALEGEAKTRYGEIRQRLSELSTRFSENVLDATNAWSKTLDSAEALVGLPHSALAAARQSAEQQGESGYRITLEFPSYVAVMTHAEDRALRQEVYTAFATRASDQGPHAGQWDNQALIDETLALRHELANLLGFGSYADYSLATKMAETPAEVIAFLEDLAERSLPMARHEFAELAAFAEERDGIDQLQAWDVTYYAEQLKQHRYQLSQEVLRAYFPVSRVLDGLFRIVGQLFGIEVVEQPASGLWHPDARLFEIQQDGDTIGHFYLDLYARAHKRGGAWMDVCRTRRRCQSGELQLPVAYLVCNFNPPVGDQPALLTHNEVTTLFHEFGHGLHHLLTEVETSPVSGIAGVAWDAVELPSQFLENWCWESQALGWISGHVDSGEPLPDDLLQQMLAAKNFQSGMMMVRQLEFALFDMRLHQHYDPSNPQPVQRILDHVRQQVAVVEVPVFNRFQCSFSHIFAGGYAAGYYSYKWAELLSADAFSRFEEEGVFNQETGQSFRREILARGGSRDALELFCAFRGRKPTPEALLRHSGITTTAGAGV